MKQPSKGKSFEVLVDYSKKRLKKISEVYPEARKYNKKIVFTVSSGLPIRQASEFLAKQTKELIGDVHVQVRTLETFITEVHNFRGEHA